jgi:alpha-1,6-mannosyltransferase
MPSVTWLPSDCESAPFAACRIEPLPVKICDLTQFYSPVSGGVKRYLNEKVAYIRKYTDDRHILVIPGDANRVEESDREIVYTIKSPLISRTSRYRMLLRLHVVERVLEKECPDVIEVGDPYQTAWKAIASGRALRIPVVAFYHSHFPEAYLRSTTKFFGKAATEFVMDSSRRYIRALYSRFAMTMVPSPALGAVLKDWGVPNIRNVDLGVNTDVFYPKPAENVREKLGIPANCTLLLYVGRLAHEKNTKTLFDSFAKIDAESPGQFHLLVIGDGTQRDYVQKLQSTTRSVTWDPYCSDSVQLARYYNAADIFVHPGVQETFGLVTLESQACGTPVVGIKGSYMDRIIFTDQKHWATENTPEALASAVRQASKGDLQTTGRELAARVAGRYSWKLVFDRIFNVYREVRC